MLISFDLKLQRWEVLGKTRGIMVGAIAYNPSDGYVYASNDTFFDSYKVKSISVYTTDLKLVRKVPLAQEFFHQAHGLLHMEFVDGVLVFANNRTIDTKIAQAQIVAIDPQCGKIQEIQ